MVWVFGFRVQGLGFRVSGLGVQGFAFGVLGLMGFCWVTGFYGRGGFGAFRCRV